VLKENLERCPNLHVWSNPPSNPERNLKGTVHTCWLSGRGWWGLAVRATWWDPDQPRTLPPPIQWDSIQVLLLHLNVVGTIACDYIDERYLYVTLENITHMTMYTHTDDYIFAISLDCLSEELLSSIPDCSTWVHLYSLVDTLYMGRLRQGFNPHCSLCWLVTFLSSSSNSPTSLDLIGAIQTSHSHLDSLSYSCFLGSDWICAVYEHGYISKADLSITMNKNGLWARRLHQSISMQFQNDFNDNLCWFYNLRYFNKLTMTSVYLCALLYQHLGPKKIWENYVMFRESSSNEKISELMSEQLTCKFDTSVSQRFWRTVTAQVSLATTWYLMGTRIEIFNSSIIPIPNKKKTVLSFVKVTYHTLFNSNFDQLLATTFLVIQSSTMTTHFNHGL